jgi:hypothetical protein
MSKKKLALPPELAAAAAAFRDRARSALGRLDEVATNLEELMSRASGTFLGGNLLPILVGALFQQGKQETQEALSRLEREFPHDIIDHVDFFAGALGELAALLKLLAAMELGAEPEMLAQWERVAEALHFQAAELQQAVEEFEDEFEALED